MADNSQEDVHVECSKMLDSPGEENPHRSMEDMSPMLHHTPMPGPFRRALTEFLNVAIAIAFPVQRIVLYGGVWDDRFVKGGVL